MLRAQESRWSVLNIRDTGNYIELSVIDNGVGIPKSKQDKLFSTFNSENISYGTASEKGTGLGLQISKNFVKKNNGSMAVSSTEGKGSIFSFQVPKGKTKISKAYFEEQFL